ncbi:MAG: beta-1,6-glucan synthase [Betaproteobacteria bacterium HGW-Betaproteobacteria-21]|nr:MAG: beta-1,6-glucan synthase [Betaproteobacteria bacterium HGW-Betaproteobacteria-21]
MTTAHPTRQTLWIALLITHLLGLVALLAWILWQAQPVAMHDLQLASGEKLKCVSYAPYHRPGQTPFDETGSISRAQIADDLAALAKITDCVRLYSVDQGLDQVPEVARAVGLKVLVGAWIGRDQQKNAIELDRAIAVSNANKDVVSALIVGNEVLLRRERSVDEMRALIDYAQSKAEVPITYADVWEFWVRNDSLAKSVDFVTVHILPFWEDDPVDIEYALKHVAAIHHEVSEHFKGSAILIGETGWPSAGRQREASKPSPVNQARYIREFVHQAHDRGWNYNLIEAIDQPWKRRLEGTVGGHWGMLDAGTLEPKFPLAGPVADRKDLATPLMAAVAGAVLALILALASGQKHHTALRTVALTLTGATSGLIASLNLEHAHLAYRDLTEWAVLGGVALVALMAAAALACWQGDRIPAAADGWRALRTRPTSPATADVLGTLRGVLLFAAAVAALLLLVDSRYRDFPSLLYLIPAALYGVVGWWQRSAGRAERICALVIAISVIGRWLPEPANPQAVGWLLVGLVLALPVLWPRANKHEQT